MFVKTLFSPYTAEVEYMLETDGNSICGTARVTKDVSAVRFDVSSPDPYTGMSMVSETGESSYISFTYSGIRADLPKNVLDKLNLVLSLFSDENAAFLEKSAGKNFVRCEETYAVEGLAQTVPYMTEFDIGDIHCIYVYDSLTGTPLDLYARSGGSAAEVKIKKFKTNENLT